MKVYTKTGDRGKTSLFSGERVLKCHDRVETYGEIDELNSFIGMLLTFLPKEEKQIVSEIQNIQRVLFQIGSWLAVTPDSGYAAQLSPLDPAFIENLEQSIDQMDQALPELHSFILPGGGQAAATAHVARTICRRAERHLIRLVQNEKPLGKKTEERMAITQIYLNRLSDYFFILARYCNMLMDIADIEYLPQKKPADTA
ncbi:MAG: cob(I)yrinic acid a,c-diamide adenosyltransferase [Desulfobacteraceae bacterium]|nr:MAG: cob(I)yrinic acid a,c-diamide adenosyltransferase [Desulfobacteraceae bacterium]